MIVLLGLFSFFSDIHADHLSGSIQLTARMNGNNEVPPVSTSAQGLGVFTLSLDKESILVNVSVADLTGPITGIHIHEGPADGNGGVVFDLTPFVVGNRVQTTLKNLTSEQRANFLSGAYYLNVHTEMNPGGEIRAQILIESDFRYTAYLKGENEVPAVSTAALGWGSFNLSKAGHELEINVSNTGLSGPIMGAHLHLGAAGTNGPVIEDLTPFLSGNHISAVVNPSSYIQDIRAGNVYINVHTASNPGGEIRAQLVLQSALTFDAAMNGAQEIPAVSTSAQALATANVDFNLQNITVHIIADGLSGPITGCHIHAAGAGSNGAVVYDLTPFVTGNEVLGTVALTGIASLNEMLSGAYYFNIHTAANPGGEIRGQIYKLSREGYVYDIDGGSEVPSTMSPGKGVGMVTIDRNQSNAHYMAVVSGLGEPIMGAHFHNAPAGANGPVIYDLTSSFANFNNTAAYGYWTGLDANPFSSATSLMFRDHEVYLNLHTATYPGGAIRGNSIRGRELPDNLLWVPLGRQGSLFPMLPFEPDGNEVYNWFNAAGEHQATFNGIIYYTPTAVGAYYVEVSDPETPDCLYRSTLRSIDDLTGCCELDGEGEGGENACAFEFTAIEYGCKSSFSYDLSLNVSYDGPGNPDLQFFVDGFLFGSASSSPAGQYEITLLNLDEGSHSILVVTEDGSCQADLLQVDQECP